MYLDKSFYIDKNIEIYKNKKLIYSGNKVTYRIPAGQWRKAYHIHEWLADNADVGIDYNAMYFVPREKLAELLKVCKKVKANPEKAEELLPTYPDVDYDEEYFYDIDETIKILEEALKDKKVDYLYSTWF